MCRRCGSDLFRVYPTLRPVTGRIGSSFPCDPKLDISFHTSTSDPIALSFTISHNDMWNVPEAACYLYAIPGYHVGLLLGDVIVVYNLFIISYELFPQITATQTWFYESLINCKLESGLLSSQLKALWSWQKLEILVIILCRFITLSSTFHIISTLSFVKLHQGFKCISVSSLLLWVVMLWDTLIPLHLNAT